MHLDVSDPQDWKNALNQAIAAFGYVDVLVNNAGIIPKALGSGTYSGLADTNPFQDGWGIARRND